MSFFYEIASSIPVSGSSVTGLTPAQVLFGSAAGRIGQSTSFSWDGATLAVTGTLASSGSLGLAVHGVRPNLLVVSGSTGRVGIGGGSGGPAVELDVYRSLDGSSVRTRTFNQSNTANSHAGHLINVAGGLGGDPFVQVQVQGGGKMSMGLDNSDTDSFKMTFDATEDLGTNPFLMVRGNNNVIIGSGSLYSGTEVSNYLCIPASSGAHAGALAQVGQTAAIAVGIGKNGRPHLFANVGGTWFSASFQNG